MVVTTLSIECLGYFLIKDNVWIFNIYVPLELIFYFLLFRYLIANEKIKLLLLVFLIVFVAFSAANILFFQGLHTFNNYTLSLGSVVIASCVLAYYKQLLNSSNPEQLIRVPMFWISTGLLLFYTCNFVFMGLFHYILGVSMVLASQLFMIIIILNILMYTLFTIGIISAAKQYKKK